MQQPSGRPSRSGLAAVSLAVATMALLTACGSEHSQSSKPTTTTAVPVSAERSAPSSTSTPTSTSMTTVSPTPPTRADSPTTAPPIDGAALRAQLDRAGTALDTAATATQQAGDALDHNQEGTAP
ncbi:MAG TPA: hypothetical protein PLS63_10680 [Microthrixaceae bacterium]|nr:hypothetical protein [Microthrixaceae bacterium]